MASDELMDSLVQVSFEVTAILTRVAAAHDLSLTQLRLLAILRDREPTMSELAGHLRLDRSSVSGLVDRASSRGLVRRIASEADRRSSRVALTDAGQALAGEGEAAVATLIGEVTASLSPDQQQDLKRLLTHLLPSTSG